MVQEFGVEVAHDAEDELVVLVVLFVVGVFVVWVVEAPHFVEVFQAPQTEGEDVLLHQRVDSVGVLDPSVFLFDGEFAAFYVGAVDGSSRDLAEGELVDDVLPNRFVDADGDGAHELFESGGVLARFVQKGGEVERAVVVSDGGSGGEFGDKFGLFGGDTEVVFHHFFVLFKNEFLKVGLFPVPFGLFLGEPNGDVLHGFATTRLLVASEAADASVALPAIARVADDGKVFLRRKVAPPVTRAFRFVAAVKTFHLVKMCDGVLCRFLVCASSASSHTINVGPNT